MGAKKKSVVLSVGKHAVVKTFEGFVTCILFQTVKLFGKLILKAIIPHKS